MEVPDLLKYTKTHEWARHEGRTIRCGITDYAQHEISDLVFVELPAPGCDVKQGDVVAVAESVKAAFDIYAPASGRLSARNEALEANPGLVNEDPYGGGWFFEIELSDPQELNALMDSSAYRSHLETFAHGA